ncbi:DUF5995 family protein [Flavobacterium sp.]|uniref:DUF5995 family protein n=1 Tax=Flavobacterium sp. TaxID=239 RepID=UPI002C02437B|nr:DUF5995 family protein [Flavobacterium sp.]HSD08679.1 DUF5995 family protein [Flavobacterium sp.]
MNIKEATTITEVMQCLDEIIERSKIEQCAIGLFATLYREVTLQIKNGIETGLFENPERMEKIDVIFANRYLKAYYQFKAGEKPSECWQFSFTKGEEYWPIVGQHLLLGINAHVNLDLGIACAQVSTPESIFDLHSDYNKINEILSNLVNGVEECLVKIWPTLTYILKLSGKIDNFFIDFSMKTARDGAWKYATEFVLLPENQRESSIQQRDIKVTRIARLVSNPGYFVSTIFKLIRLFEKGTVADKIIELSKVQYNPITKTVETPDCIVQSELKTI